MLSTLDFSYVRALNPGQRDELFLSDPLGHTSGTHRLTESLCRLGFIGGCTKGTAPLNATFLHHQKRQAIHAMNVFMDGESACATLRCPLQRSSSLKGQSTLFNEVRA
jgi:hypothetical protein